MVNSRFLYEFRFLEQVVLMLSKFCSFFFFFFLFWCESGIKGLLGLINFTLVIAFLLYRKVGCLDETQRETRSILLICISVKFFVCCAVICITLSFKYKSR